MRIRGVAVSRSDGVSLGLSSLGSENNSVFHPIMKSHTIDNIAIG